jgi:formate hydrogenlyase subunit 3/multisubunit Na+/H+ antiporter MnhD subunit
METETHADFADAWSDFRARADGACGLLVVIALGTPASAWPMSCWNPMAGRCWPDRGR